VFKLVEGEFADTGAYVDILMDDMAFPSYSSAKIKSKHTTFNEGESRVLSLAVRF
jgi:Ca2+-dependent lipid-binding protein